MCTRFLNNSRLLTDLVCSLVLNAINTTEIVIEDEERCKKRDIQDVLTTITNGLAEKGVSREENAKVMSIIVGNSPKTKPLSEEITSISINEGEITELLQKAREKKCIRIVNAYNMLRIYIRASHNLDPGGYKWNLFFDKETDEPEEERNYREMFNVEKLRTDLRHKCVYLFAKHTYIYLDAIHRKDLDFLIDHLSSLFPNTEFTDRISVIFGPDDTGSKTTTKYVNPEDMVRIWRIVQGCVKNGLYYCYAYGIEHFDVNVLNAAGVKVLTRYIIDYEKEAARWELVYPKL